MALMTIIMGLGLLFYILLGLRKDFQDSDCKIGVWGARPQPAQVGFWGFGLKVQG